MDEVNTIDYRREVKGTLVSYEQWPELTADQLREAITNGDMVVIKRDDGTYIAARADECDGHIEHCSGYFRPSWGDIRAG
jgi:hypothetical protein